MKTTFFGIVALACLPVSATPEAPQAAPIPYRTQTLLMRSGTHAGRAGEPSLTAFRQEVRVANAPWLRLQLGDHNLGAQSFVTIRSVEDGFLQRLDAASMRQWQSRSAFFNGEAVEVELHLAPEDKGAFVDIAEVMVGERQGAPTRAGDTREAAQQPDIEAVCGGSDERVASNDRAVGRIVPVGCTGWIVSSGAFLTAGHCAGADMQTLEFNVPASDADGEINHPPPRDQYPIQQATIDFSNGGVGNDWAVFDVGSNADTGLRPARAQNAFFRMSRDSNPGTFRIPGFGVDGPGPCFGSAGQPGCNTPAPARDATNQTQQTHTGQNSGESGSGSSVSFSYVVDTQGGNSGSPIGTEGTNLTVGIHTNGGCSASGGANRGTSFENDDLEAAIQVFPGAQTVYVDKDQPVSTKDGTVFRPFDTLPKAIDAVPAGGIVSIVTGSYAFKTTITKPMTLTAPVGRVTIGG